MDCFFVVRPLQFTGILGGRTQFAPTDYEENFFNHKILLSNWHLFSTNSINRLYKMTIGYLPEIPVKQNGRPMVAHTLLN